MAVVVADAVEALAQLAPGPALGAALASIDPARVANQWLPPLLVAQSRQAAHEAARMLGVVAEVGRANPTFDDTAVDRLDHCYRYCADEVSAALSWSRRAAEAETDLAEQVVHELPLVYAAFLRGEIDRQKVRTFAQHCGGLTPEQIATVCQKLVPVVGRLTPGQLGVRLRRLIAAIDPKHYERRYRKALRDRWVCAWLDDTGTAVLTARGLTPAQAQAAVERIDLLAHATRRAGHPSTLDQIRVDIVAGLLDGTLHQLTHNQIIAHLIAHRSSNDDGVPTNDATNGVPDGAGAAGGGPAGGGAAGGGAADCDTAGGQPAAGDPEPSDDEPSTPSAEDDAAEDTTAGAPSDENDMAEGEAEREDHRVGVEVRVALSTLLGHDQHPGEVAGLGPVPAAHAREIVAQQRRAEWRFAVTDPDGRLLYDGITRRRPLHLTDVGPPGGIVELHIPAHTLPALLAASTAATTTATLDNRILCWSRVIADIARQYADRDQPDAEKPDGANSDRLGQPELDAHPDDRLPRAALRRHIQIRDRTCVGVGCRRRPRRCDQDHTIEHQHGGKTVAADLGPLCRHDHVLKTKRGWTLEQPTPGSFVWTTGLQARYHVRPDPVLPPQPEPCPQPYDPVHDEPPDEAAETLTVWKPTPKPPKPAKARPPPSDPDEKPPF